MLEFPKIFSKIRLGAKLHFYAIFQYICDAVIYAYYEVLLLYLY